MSEPAGWNGAMPATRQQQRQPASGPPPSAGDGSNLADILERVLDKGIVIAGDVQINLLDIELLTIKLRLVVASVDRAKEMGIDWWERDPTLSSGYQELEEENERLRERLAALEDGGRGELEEPADRDDPADEDEPLEGELVDEEPVEDEPVEEEPAPAPRRRRRPAR